MGKPAYRQRDGRGRNSVFIEQLSKFEGFAINFSGKFSFAEPAKALMTYDADDAIRRSV